ncbi:hypothetical protein ACFYO0_03110 [Streptomyces sp. NPDC006365]
MVTNPVHGAPAAPSARPPARHTGTVIAGCSAPCPARLSLAPTEAEGSAA